jgi:O-antigen ligase
MLKLVEGSLMICVTAAVLAFGGTEPSSFAVIELVLLGTAAAALYSFKEFTRPNWLGIAATPTALIALVAFQLLPLPAGVCRWLRPEPAIGNPTAPQNAEINFSSLSVAPYLTRTHLIILVCCLVVFFFARILGKERESRRRLMTWLLALGAVEALYGLIHYLSGCQKIFTYVKKYNLEEATGTYINRNHFAGLLEMAIPFGLALVLYEAAKFARQERPASGMKIKGIKRFIAGENASRVGLQLLASIVMVAGLIFSRSRMGLLAGASSLAVMAIFSGLQRRSALWIAAVMMICVAVLVLWLGAGDALGRFGDIGQEYSSVDESRVSIWKDTARLIGWHPLLGSGLGTFPVAFTEVQRTFLGKFVNHAHNDYLELASDLGIPGAGLLFGSIGMLVARLARKTLYGEGRFDRTGALACLASIGAILLHSLTDFNLYIPANALVFSAILGMGAAIVSADTRGMGQRSEA